MGFEVMSGEHNEFEEQELVVRFGRTTMVGCCVDGRGLNRNLRKTYS
jgi:hypothetical protein